MSYWVDEIIQKIKVKYGDNILKTGFCSIDIEVNQNTGQVNSNWRGDGDYALATNDILKSLFIDYPSMGYGDVFYLGSLMVRYVTTTDDGRYIIVKQYSMDDEKWVGRFIELQDRD